MPSFADLLRELRQPRMSQRQLASLSGVDKTTISLLETGGRAPSSREQVLMLARGLDLSPPETDGLLEAAGLEPEMAWEVPDLDARDPTLREFLHTLSRLTRERGSDVAQAVLHSALIFLRGALHDSRVPGIRIAASPPAEATQLRPGEEQLDELLQALAAGRVDDQDIERIEKTVSEGGLSWEMRRRVSETLTALVEQDPDAAGRVASHLRSDYDPLKARTDVRRRVVEAVPFLYPALKERAVPLLEPQERDEVYVAIATMEALHDLPDLEPDEAQRLRQAVLEREHPDHAGVLEFVVDLLAAVRDEPAAVRALVEAARDRDRVFRIVAARVLSRLLPARPDDAFDLIEHFLRNVEGSPAEHANVRRSIAMGLPQALELLGTDYHSRARAVVSRLAQDGDVHVRRAVADVLPGLAERDAHLAQQVISLYLLSDSDPYIRRRAWGVLAEVEGQS